jgi:peroxiredoxin Q/BCP
MTKLKIGIKAPLFTLPNQEGDKISLKNIAADYVVLYFYPKDLTPGCTTEANEFSKFINKFTKLNTRIIGISGGSVDSKSKFCKKHNLKIDLLADEDFVIAEKYEAYGEKKFMGRTFQGIHRKTFIINSSGKIVQIYNNVKAAGHAEEVLGFLSEASNEAK